MSAWCPQADAAHREEPGTPCTGTRRPCPGPAAWPAVASAVLRLRSVRATGRRERDAGGLLRLLPARAQRDAGRGVRLLRGLLRM